MLESSIIYCIERSWCGTAEYGHAFEHLVIQELRAWLSYSESEEKLSYWRTYTGLEVDAVIGDARIAIEIKSVEEVMYRHLKGLKAFAEDYPDSRQLVVSLDPINRRMGNIECIYVLDFSRCYGKDKSDEADVRWLAGLFLEIADS